MKNIISLSTVFFFVLAISAVAQSAERRDPAKVVGPDECGKCHVNEFKAWKGTNHFRTYEELHKRPKAKEIMKALNIPSPLRNKESKCWTCHYTIQGTDKKKALCGISCESCHGAGKEWIYVHNDTTKMKVAERNKKVDGMGMIRPDRTYFIAENCYQCHTIPDEKLVNAGHPASSNFNLVEWSQGEIRHNFQTGQGKNAEASLHKRRMLYILGEVMEFEYGLRGLAKATDEKGAYYQSMLKKFQASLSSLAEIKKLTGIPEIGEMVDGLRKEKLDPKKFSEELKNKTLEKKALACAEVVKQTAMKFADSYTGKEDKLKPIDAKLPKAYKGKPTE